MNQYVRLTIASLALAALTSSVAAPALANTSDTADLQPMLELASTWRQERAAKLAGLDPANATYLIDDQPVTLVGGVSEVPAAPGSASKVVTRLADHLAAGDLTGDGKIDLAAVLTQETGGTGTFFYLGALVHDGTPIKAAFLGDRIAVQNVRIVDGKVVVDLLTRGANEPFVVPPHIKETQVYEVKGGALVPVGQ